MSKQIKVLLLVLLSLLLMASALNDARKANEAFRNGDYETAVQLYRSAISQQPDDARLYYNLGTALSKLGRGEEAMEAYSQFRGLTDNPRERAMADYNAGTMLSENEMYDEAAELFRSALIQNPDDDDARHNFEMALRRQQEQQEQEQQQQQDQQDGDGEQDQDQQQQDDGDQQQDQQPEGQQDQQPQDQEQDQGELPQPQELTPGEAENILNALEQLERELLENRKKESTERVRNERDW